MAVAGIFVSYRRQDSAGHAGRIVDRLEHRFGKRRVFMDVEAVKAGTDFVEAIDTALDRCFAFVAVIGPDWLDLRDSDGRRRLDDPDDFIRRELSHALEKGVRVVPVLVQGATMPAADRLPEDLRRLSRIQALKVSDERWDYDTGRLMEALEERSRYGRVLKIAVPAAVVAIAGAIAYWQLADPLWGPAVDPPQPINTGDLWTAADDPGADNEDLPRVGAPAAASPARVPKQEPPTSEPEPPAPAAVQEARTPAAEPEIVPLPEAPTPSQEPPTEPEPEVSLPSPEAPAPVPEPVPAPPPDRRAGWCLPGGRPVTGSRCAPGYYARFGVAQGWMLTPDSVTIVEPVPASLPAKDILGWCVVRQLEPGQPLAGSDIGGCRPGSYARHRAGRGWMLLPKSVIAMEPLPANLPLEDLVGWCLNKGIEPGEHLVPGIVTSCRERLYAGRRLLTGERLARPDLIRGAGRLSDATLEKLAGRCARRRVESGQPFGPGDLQPCG